MWWCVAVRGPHHFTSTWTNPIDYSPQSSSSSTDFLTDLCVSVFSRLLSDADPVSLIDITFFGTLLIDVWTTSLLSPLRIRDDTTYVCLPWNNNFIFCPYPFSFVRHLHALSTTLTVGCTFSAAVALMEKRGWRSLQSYDHPCKMLNKEDTDISNMITSSEVLTELDCEESATNT
jgi:hypothetical protein